MTKVVGFLLIVLGATASMTGVSAGHTLPAVLGLALVVIGIRNVVIEF